MLIVLFRHGPAGHIDPVEWPDDRLRPLSEEGVRRTSRAARGLVELLGDRTHILTSPLVRAAATAEILSAALDGAAEVERDELLAPGAPHRAVLERLARFDPEQTIVLVGHEPDLGKLAGALLFGAPRAIPLKKAGACAIRFDGTPKAGDGELSWFLAPRLLRRLGRHGKKRGRVTC